ncbi:MAG: hypothetical protein PHR77_00390 [Kiritimatiellae bacterium]|nr:hypothetical protein [Kiritimatiellia bacterium]MDD5519839.1 hypothetical protein [Kiritimatiellia bacterium]
MKTIKILVILYLIMLTSGCCALSTAIGPTAKMHGQVCDQNGKPVPYCPLQGDWEHSLSQMVYMWLYYGHSTLFLSDQNGNWDFSRRGVDRIFVKVGKDCNDRFFPGYKPGHNWMVGGHPKEINPTKSYHIEVLLDTNLVVKPYFPSSNDFMGERYKHLRRRLGLP